MSRVDLTKVYTLEEVERAREDMFLQEEIIKQFLPLVRKIAHKYKDSIALLDFDDKVQIGMEGILKAINTYKGLCAFSTHVYNNIFYAISHEKRKQCSIKNFYDVDTKTQKVKGYHVSSLDFVLENDRSSNSNETLSDIISDNKESQLDLVLKKERVELIKGVLMEKDKEAFELVVFKDKTQVEAAKVLNVYQSVIGRRARSAEATIRSKFSSASELKDFLYN